MPQNTKHQVGDSVAKIDDEVAVGEDLGFQQSWWRFERVMWSIFLMILLLDISGLFGRGPLAKAQKRAADGSMQVKYERVERTGTPSILTIEFGSQAIRNGKIVLFASQSMVKELGTQRIIPAPESTTVGNGGLTYMFPATMQPATVEFALQPSGPGVFHFELKVPDSDSIQARVAVVP